MKDKTNTSGSTLHGICRTFIYKFSEMMIEKHNDIQSIVELPFNLISEEYVSYLSHHGYKLTHRLGSKSHLTADMNYKTYYAKADSIYYFQKYYRYVEDFYYPNTTPEREKDTWDIRKLGIPYNVLPARPRYTINYGKITQNWLKERVKEYNYIRIPKQSISTVLDDMKAFSLFSEFLSVSYHKIQKMNNIDRRLIKIYINFVRSKAYETTTFNRRISAIKTFLELGNALGLEGFPQKELFKKTDFVKRRKMPVPFSDNELNK